MDLTTLAVAGMSLIGTLAGTFGGILVSNKLTTYRIEQLEKKYQGSGYGDFKKDLVEVVVDALAPIQQKYNDVMESGELDKILKEGAEKAGAIAQKTLRRVKENFGLGL